jgi:hypothetical protein
MRLPNIGERLLLRVVTLELEPKGWRNNVIRVTPTNSQQNV